MATFLDELYSKTMTHKKSALDELYESAITESYATPDPGPERDVFKEGIKEFDASSLVSSVIRGQRNPEQPAAAPVFDETYQPRREPLAVEPSGTDRPKEDTRKIGIAESLARQYGSGKPGRIIPGWAQDAPILGAAALGLTPAAPLAVPAMIGGMVWRRGAAVDENMRIQQAATRLMKGDKAYQRPAGVTGPMPGEIGPDGKFVPAKPIIGEEGWTANKDEDQKLVVDWVKWAKEETERGVTVPAQIQQGLSLMAPWMAEFAATGGLAKLGDKVGESAVKWALGKYASKGLQKAAGVVAGGAAQGGVGFSPMTAETIAKRQAEVATGLRPSEGWATSTMKAVGDSIIQAGSERTGEYLTGGLGYAIKKIPGGSRIMKNLEAKWTKLTGGTASAFAEKMATTAGYSSILGEIGEEGVADALTAAFGIENFGQGEDSTVAQRLNAAMGQFFQNIPVMAATFAVPGVAKAAIRYAYPDQQTVETERKAAYDKAVEKVAPTPEPVQVPPAITTAAPAVETPPPPTAGTPPADTPLETPASPPVDSQKQIDQYRSEAKNAMDPDLFEVWQFNFDQSLERGYTPDESYKAASDAAAERAKEPKPVQGSLFSDEGPKTSYLDNLFNQTMESQPEPTQTTPLAPEKAVEGVAAKEEVEVIPPAPAEEDEIDLDLADSELLGKHLSTDPLSKPIRDRIVGDVRRKIMEHPAVSSMSDLHQQTTEDLSFRVPLNNATDVKEAIAAIQDPKVRAAVKRQISYAKSKDEVVQNSPDTVIEQLAERGVKVNGISGLISFMASTETGRQRTGPTSAAIKKAIFQSGDPYGKYLIRLEENLDRFSTVGEVDQFTMKEMESEGIQPFAYAQDLFSYQNVEAARIAKMKPGEKRDSTLRRAAVMNVMLDRRAKAEKEAAALLKANGFTGVTIELGETIEDIEGAFPEKPDDDIPFEKRGQRAVGVYLNRKGQEVLGFVLGSDQFTGSHEFYHWAERRLPKSDQSLLKRDLSADAEIRADAFAQYRNTQQKPKNNLIKAIFDKIMKMLDRLRRILASKGFRTYEDIFFDLSQGKANLGRESVQRGPQTSKRSYDPSDAEIQAEMANILNEAEGMKKRVRPKARLPKSENDQARKTALLYPKEVISPTEVAIAGGHTPRTGNIPMPADTGTPPLNPDLIPVLQSGAPGTPKPPRGSVTAQGRSDDWYRQNRKATPIPLTKRLGRKLEDFWLDFNKIVTPISYRIEKYSPEMFRMTRGYIQNRMVWTTQLLERVVPYIKLTKQLSADDRADLNMALMMGDTRKIGELNAKIPGATQAHADVREVLDELFQRATELGIEMNYQEEFWARELKDQKGLMQEFGLADRPIIDDAINDTEDTRRRYLSEEEKGQVLTTLIFTGKMNKYLSRSTDPTKGRKLDVLPGNLIRHYHDYGTGLMLYIEGMVDKISKREFFNRVDPTMNDLLRKRSATTTRLARLRSRKPKDKGPVVDINKYNNRLKSLVMTLAEVNDKIRTNANADTKDLLGTWFANLKIDEVKQRDLVEAVTALFTTKQMHPALKGFMNLAYVDTLASPLRALSNLQDLGITFYRSKFYGSIAFLKVLAGKDQGALRSTIAKTIGSEYQTENLYSVTRQILGAAGQGMFDRIGKRTLVETVLMQYQHEARRAKPSKGFWDRVARHVGPRDVSQAVQDFKNGEITDLVRTVMFGELCDVQPLSMLERPEWYVRHPNGRIFYMLRGVTLRQLNFAAKEAHEAAKDGTFAGHLKAFGRLLRLAFWVTLFGGSIGMIKAIFRGQEIKDASPYFVDGLMQYLLIFNRYTARRLEDEGISGVAADAIIPPLQFWDSLYRDLSEEDPEKQGEVMRTVPVIGDMWYWWLGAGSRKKDRNKSKNYF